MRIEEYFDEIVNNLYLFQKKDLEQIKKRIKSVDIEQLDQLLEEGISFGLHSVTEKALCTK